MNETDRLFWSMLGDRHDDLLKGKLVVTRSNDLERSVIDAITAV